MNWAQADQRQDDALARRVHGFRIIPRAGAELCRDARVVDDGFCLRAHW